MFLLMATLNKRICLGRRLDGVEQKLNGHDQAQRNLMEQIMKLSQEMKVLELLLIYHKFLLKIVFDFDDEIAFWRIRIISKSSDITKY